jgi:hypothetical protein
MDVWMYICMYICMYLVCMNGSDMYVCTHVFMYDVCVYVCMHVCMYTFIHTIRTKTNPWDVCLCTNQDAAYQNHGFKRAYQPCVSRVSAIHTYMCMYACSVVYIRNVYAYVYVSIVCIHKYICTHAHTVV